MSNALIKTIAVGDTKITLSSDMQNYYKQIFQVDSIAMLVGKNGSGKTYCLEKIASSFSPNQLDDATSCIFSMENREIFHTKAPNSYAAIFYTPVPTKRKFRRSSRLIDASPDTHKISNPLALRDHQDIIRYFGIAPQLVAKISITPSKITYPIIEYLCNSSLEKINAPTKVIELVNEIKNLKSKINNSQLGNEQEDDGRFKDDDAAESIESTIRKKKTIAAQVVYDTLKNEFSQERIFIAFAAIEKTPIKYRSTPKSVTGALEELLSFKIIQRPTDGGYTQHYKAQENFDRLNRIHIYDYRLIENGTTVTLEMPVSIGDDLDSYEDLISIEWSGMSSGQWALANQIASIDTAAFTLAQKNFRKILILIDEGDTYLHLDWQRRYIGLINDLLGALKIKYNFDVVQTIVATHSPLLATDTPRDLITNLENTLQSEDIGFAAPLQNLLNASFNSGTIGEVAVRTISQCVARLKNGQASEFDDYIIEIVDDPVIKNHLKFLKSSLAKPASK